MVKWHVTPPMCILDSCIVNIYDEGDYIPPHIDQYDFLWPFCTISFLNECNIIFSSTLKVVDIGEFSGPVSISLPIGYVSCKKKKKKIKFIYFDHSNFIYFHFSDPCLIILNGN